MAKQDEVIKHRVTITFNAEMPRKELGWTLATLKQCVDRVPSTTSFGVTTVPIEGAAMDDIVICQELVFTLCTDFVYAWSWTFTRSSSNSDGINNFNKCGNVPYDEDDTSVEFLLEKVVPLLPSLPKERNVTTKLDNAGTIVGYVVNW